MNGVKSNNDYPHAPWWSYDESTPASYNPAASLLGFLLRYSEKGSEEYCFAEQIAKNAFDYLKKNAPIESMHEAACFVELYEYLESGKITDVIDLAEFRNILEIQINNSITNDISKWNKEYICNYECKFIEENQNIDGTWDWTEYPQQWSIAKNWWRSDIIINNLKYLKKFGKAPFTLQNFKDNMLSK